MYSFLTRIDRRWVFLLMLLAITIPILTGMRFPERPSDMTQSVFDAIDALPEGSKVLMAWDYDPTGTGELQPMAAAFTRHCAERHHKLIYMTLWPQGPPMLDDTISLLNREYPDYTYGRDYVNLGFRPGYEGVIKVVVSDLKELYANDVQGNSLSDLPLTRDIKNVQQMDLIINVSSGYPGTKEWVLYASTPYRIPTVSGTAGVQAPILYPYVPAQLAGLLAGIKSAAEYEQLLITAFPKLRDNKNSQEGLRRMGPQLVGHMLIVALIVIGNLVYFHERKQQS